MFDTFNRRIHYLRISVTDRCNLRCRYCMPEEGVRLLPHGDILTFEEIAEAVKVAADMGINKIRLTGGEPLVRKGIPDLVSMISGIREISDIAMTTNGIYLAGMAGDLHKAGLKRVNVSLDTLDPERFRHLTRGGDLTKVLDGIEAARTAGLDPVKINCVVQRNSDEEDARMVKEFAQKENLTVRFIRQMNLEYGEFGVVEGGDGGNCSICNRLRLTANGMIKPCLFSDFAFSVRQLGMRNAILCALQNKPRKGWVNHTGSFYGIGG
jgi:cyclic pyranopterin phosphate synthase